MWEWSQGLPCGVTLACLHRHVPPGVRVWVTCPCCRLYVTHRTEANSVRYVQAIFDQVQGSTLGVMFGGYTVSTPFEFYDCTKLMVESVSPSASLSSGGSLVVMYVRNLSPYSASLPMTVIFGDVETTASVTAAEGSTAGTAVTLARIEFRLPSVTFQWEVTGSLQQSNGVNIPFPFSFEAPCDYQEFCTSLVTTVWTNDVRLAEHPPTSSVCDRKYCLAMEEIPTPFLVAVQPTEALTTGGTSITVILTGFPAVTDTGLVEIRIGKETNSLITSPENIQVLAFGGDSGMNSKVELDFVAPYAPMGPGHVTVVVSVRYGAHRAQAPFELLYVRPISGPVQISYYTPKSAFLGAERLGSAITVEMTNIDQVDVSAGCQLQLQPFDSRGNSVLSGGKTSFCATSILKSTSQRTSAVFPLPSSLAVGMYSFRVNQALNSADRAGVVSFEVKELPSPTVVSIFPRTALLLRTTLLTISVQYLPQSPDSLKVELNAGSTTWYLATIMSQANSVGCATRSCNTALLEVSIMPSSLAGTAQVRVCSSGFACAPTTLELLATDQTMVYNVEPKESYAVGTPTKISLYVRNFPYSLQGAARVNKDQIRVKLDQVWYPVADWTQGSIKVSDIVSGGESEDSIDQFDFYFPIAGESLQLGGKIYKDLVGAVYIADDIRDTKIGRFMFRALQRPGLPMPVDASLSGGSPVTFRVYWGLATDTGTVTVSFGNKPALVDDVKNFGSQGPVTSFGVAVHYTDISVTTPSLDQRPGMIKVTISSKDMSETITFEVFTTPTIRQVLPHRASLTGETADCAECLFHNKHSVSLWIDNFPEVSFASELRLQIGPTVCDGSACAVLDLQNLAAGLYLAVSVPPSALEGAVPITVTYTGKGALPVGMALNDEYTRSVQVAVSAEQAFSYFVVKARLVSAMYCKSCALLASAVCVSDTSTCSDGSEAIQGSDTDAIVPLGGGGVLTLFLSNAGILSASPSPIVSIGGSSASATVKSSTKQMTILEVISPTISGKGNQPGEILISDGLTLFFTALVYDDSVTVTCVSPSPPYSQVECSGPGASTITIQLTNFIIGRPQDVFKVISTHIGGVSAQKITWKCCTDGSNLILSLDVPAHDDPQLQGAFSKGRANLDLKVALIDDSLVFVRTGFSLWAPPRITSALLNSVGTSLLLKFDQTTNIPTLLKGAGSCGSIISSPRSLGAGAFCLWQGDDALLVSLGVSADISVRDSITVAVGSNVRSKNEVSYASDPVKTTVLVGEPLAKVIPVASGLFGPSSVDPCGFVEMSYVVTSPRALNYFWSCANNENLDSLLRASNAAQVKLANGTPELELQDFTYAIHVYAMDFLGISTATETLRLRKTGTASLAVSITGQDEYLSIQDVVVVGGATYSLCSGLAKGNLVYSWEVTEGDVKIGLSVLLSAEQRSKPQLYFAPATFSGGKRYKAVLLVTNDADRSHSSTASFEITVVPPALVVLIAGSPSMSVSQFATLKLDASSSYDPQVGMGVADRDLVFAWSCVMLVRNQERPCLNSVNLEQGSSLYKELGDNSLTRVPRSRSLTLCLGLYRIEYMSFGS
jgi:hypothetical protein